MKKIIFLIILLCFPITVFAAGTTNTYYIEANILKNGDMEMKELKILEGTYNGLITSLNYANYSLKTFTGEQADFDGSSIYNASGLENVKIYGVQYDKIDFGILYNENRTLFTENNFATNGQYGYYEKQEQNTYKIYMPSNYKQASLITYTLKNVVVVHNDVAEVAWDFIGKNYEDIIKNLTIIINLPDNSTELRVFSHGPLTGSNDILNRKQVRIVSNDLAPYQAIDARVVFDKSIVPYSGKLSNVSGLDKILAVEKIRADKANQIREEAIKEVEKDKAKANLIKVYFYVNLILLVVAGVMYYIKHDKERKPTFVGKYNREFIDDYNVEVIDYLMKKVITPNAMSASILNLIYKKYIKVEKKVDEKKKEILEFTKLKDPENITESILSKFLFEKVGNGQTFTDKELKNYAKSTKTYTEFESSYSSWKNMVIEEGKRQNFWDSNNLKKILIFLAIVSIGIFYFLTQSIDFNLYISYDLYIQRYILSFFNIVFIIYLFVSRKRTAKGNEDYARWKGFKNFLNDFGQFKEKDLPEIILWERYLVYATIFGLAYKVQKQMNVKIKEMNLDQSHLGGFNIVDYMIINNMVNSSVSSAVNSARTTASQVAASRMSSSGGFGGGSSFGGGGFGGGGSGGGRF